VEGKMQLFGKWSEVKKEDFLSTVQDRKENAMVELG